MMNNILEFEITKEDLASVMGIPFYRNGTQTNKEDIAVIMENSDV